MNPKPVTNEEGRPILSRVFVLNPQKCPTCHQSLSFGGKRVVERTTDGQRFHRSCVGLPVVKGKAAKKIRKASRARVPS